jgi:predicted aspartyl protease
MIAPHRPAPARLVILLLMTLLSGLASAERFGHRVPLATKPSGNYYVEIKLGHGVAGEFLVDTGSGYVVLTKETFKAVRDLPGTKHLRDIKGRLANGKAARARIYRLAELQLPGECVLKDVEVAVMAGSTRNIFGLSALRQIEPFAMELSPPSLLFSSCELSWQETATEGISAIAATEMAPRP